MSLNREHYNIPLILLFLQPMGAKLPILLEVKQL